MNDEQHFKKARDLEAVIFTHDPHFIEIAEKVIKNGRQHYGIIFVKSQYYYLTAINNDE